MGWSGEAGKSLVLEFSATPFADTETRLRQLARWIVQAERDGLEYGLRVPGAELPPENGDRHFHACLRTLATFEEVGE